jgi:hypothetical protein
MLVPPTFLNGGGPSRQRLPSRPLRNIPTVPARSPIRADIAGQEVGDGVRCPACCGAGRVSAEFGSRQ